MRAVLVALTATLALGACIPRDGPSTAAVFQSTREAGIPLIQLTEETVARIEPLPLGSLADVFNGGPYKPGIIRRGDEIEVTIFDTGEGGLFSATESSTLPVGRYIVDESGNVTLPFVGRLRVADNSVSAAQRIITERLRSSTVNPFVNVVITQKDADSYAVQGDVEAGGIFPLTSRSEKVLDAIAAAGGPSRKPGETRLTLIRGGKTASQMMGAIVTQPKDNVFLRAGDTVYVTHEPASFIADGAVTTPGEFPFTPGELNLNEALGRAGGLSDARANPRSVFVMRAVGTSEVEQTGGELAAAAPEGGPIVYRIDLTKAENRFVADKFTIRDGDLIYVTNSGLASLGKIFQVFLSRPPEIAAPSPREF
ncbi:MAG: polysaccharide biosynthesis/export family protein [Pseudomonadota bacterium]